MNKFQISLIVAIAGVWIFIPIGDLTMFLVFETIAIFFVIVLWLKTKMGQFLVNKIKNSIKNLSRKNMSMSQIDDSFVLKYTKPITDTNIMKSLETSLTNQNKNVLETAGVAADPKILASKSIRHMLISFFICVPVSIVFGIFIHSLFFMILLGPIMVLMLPLAQMKNSASERKQRTEDELAIFAVFCTIMQSVDRKLYDVFGFVSEQSIFPFLEKESKMIRRNVKLFAQDPLLAINNQGKSHPNEVFRNFLLGYVSIAKSGGDLTRYLESRAEQMLHRLEVRYQAYVNQSSIMMEMLLILLNMLPSLVITTTFLSSTETVNMLLTISFFITPVITMAVVVMDEFAKPKAKDILSPNILPIVVGLVTGILTYSIDGTLWIAFNLAMIAGAATNFLLLKMQFEEIDSFEAALPDFLRDVTEETKIGTDMNNAIIKLAGDRNYNPSFDQFLKGMGATISFGQTIQYVVDHVRIRSWFGRSFMFILSKISESGGGTTQTLEFLTNFAVKVQESKKEMIGKIKVFVYMAYGTPLMLVFSSAGIKHMLSGEDLEALNQLAGNTELFVTSPLFGDLINLLIVLSSVCMGIAVGKITKSLLFSKELLLISVITFLIIQLQPLLLSMSGS